MSKLDEKAVQDLRTRVRGDLIRPGDGATYEEARKVYNGMIDKRPGAHRPLRRRRRCHRRASTSPASRRCRWRCAAAGTTGPGLGTCDDGLVIDLSRMKGVRVDPAARTVARRGRLHLGRRRPRHARLRPGHAERLHLDHRRRRADPRRRHRLPVAHARPDDRQPARRRHGARRRQLRHREREDNADLFWAVRGGGGNFGVVTSFLFRLHPISTVYGGPMFWPLERSAGAAALVARLHPERAGGHQRLVRRSSPCRPGRPSPRSYHGKKMCVIVWCYTGPTGPGGGALQARSARSARPRSTSSARSPGRRCRACSTRSIRPGYQWYWKADFFNELTDKAIALHVKYGAQLPTMQSTMHLYPINGAAHRAGSEDDTAFSFRDANFAEVIVGVDPDPANNARMIASGRENYWLALHPLLGGRRLREHDDGRGRGLRSRPPTATTTPRLAEIKAKYDPAISSAYNQNIKPSR